MARVTDVAELVRVALAAVVGVGDDLGRCYVPDFDPADFSENVKRIRVYAPLYADGGPLSREQDTESYTVIVIVAERYMPAGIAGGDVPNAWIDSRVSWVETNVVDLLSDARQKLSPDIYCETVEVVPFAEEPLTTDGMFWSSVAFVFRGEV